MLSRTQAEPGRTVKQEQEDISRNHVQTFIYLSVHLESGETPRSVIAPAPARQCEIIIFYVAKLRDAIVSELQKHVGDAIHDDSPMGESRVPFRTL